MTEGKMRLYSWTQNDWFINPVVIKSAARSEKQTRYLMFLMRVINLTDSVPLHTEIKTTNNHVFISLLSFAFWQKWHLDWFNWTPYFPAATLYSKWFNANTSLLLFPFIDGEQGIMRKSRIYVCMYVGQL